LKQSIEGRVFYLVLKRVALIVHDGDPPYRNTISTREVVMRPTEVNSPILHLIASDVQHASVARDSVGPLRFYLVSAERRHRQSPVKSEAVS
jgi:hypothetical protein